MNSRTAYRTIGVASIIAGILLFSLGMPVHATTRVIIDTDAGTDDLMAIAYLLANPDVKIEAITVVNGLAHVDQGARNILRLLELARRTDVPVFVGEAKPLGGNAQFPETWRTQSDELAGVDLPPSNRTGSRNAVRFLVRFFQEAGDKVSILALGPLTNVAKSLAFGIQQGIESLVIMGGAISVPGNLGDGGYFKTRNKVSEWNFFIDPLAARVVFSAGIPIVLVPLDATNHVPIDAAFVRDFGAHSHSATGRMIAQIFANEQSLIDANAFYAWDPLAAAILAHPEIAKTDRHYIEIGKQGETRLIPGRQPNARVAFDADARLFTELFIGAF